MAEPPSDTNTFITSYLGFLSDAHSRIDQKSCLLFLHISFKKSFIYQNPLIRTLFLVALLIKKTGLDYGGPIFRRTLAYRNPPLIHNSWPNYKEKQGRTMVGQSSVKYWSTITRP